MGQVERRRQISARVQRAGEVAVTELAREFGVSAMTIRRDLRELEQRRQLTRTHGGAISQMPSAWREPSLAARIDDHAEAKRRIARAVVADLVDGERVFIGSGSTALAVADVVAEQERSLTVVTNALTVANALSGCPTTELVVIGGFLRPEEQSLIGHLAEAALVDLRVDRAIMGMRGVDADHGLTADNLSELATDRAIIGISEQLTVVVDPSKFGRVAVGRTAPASAASLIVTTTDAPPEPVAALLALGVDVRQV